MEKIVIDLTNNQLTEALYSDFSYNVQKMLVNMAMAGFDFPTTIRGTQKQIDAFFRALKGEKRYMWSWRLPNHDEQERPRSRRLGF